MVKNLIKKRIWRAALGILVLFSILLLGYVTALVIKINKVVDISSKQVGSKLTEVSFEAHALVKKEWFDFFLALDQKNSKTAFQQKNNWYEFAHNFSLYLPSQQDCEDLNCLQFKLDFSEIPSTIWRSLIGIEDNRFLQHEGVDWKSLARALWVDIKLAKMAQGGSTITQQLAKNLFLSQEKSIKRKLKEMLYSFIIEFKFSKQEILTAYLNEVFWGSFNGIKIKGVAAASIYYFGKNVNQLTEYESAVLISLLKGPYYLSPLNHLDRLKVRVNEVFKKLRDDSLMGSNVVSWNDADYLAFQKKLTTRIDLALPYALWSIYEFGLEQNEQPGLYQRYLIAASSHKTLQALKQKHPVSDFAIKVAVKKLSCNEQNCATYFYYSKNQRKRSDAYNSDRHQLGSILKPLVYEALLEKGIAWYDRVSTEDFELKLNSGVWKPKEVSPSKESEMTVSDALQKSRNIPMIRLVDKVGFSEIEKVLDDRIPGLLKPLKQYPSQLLGSIEKTIFEMENIFAEFIQRQCFLIKNEIYQIGETTIGHLSSPELTTVRGQASNLTKLHSFFGKTGTSNSGLDTWFVGFDGLFLTIIWVGDESRGEGKNYKHGGAGLAFPIFQEFYLYSGQRITEFQCQ